MTSTFAFTGRTRTGIPVSGERTAESVNAAVAALRREQIFVTKIDSVRQTSSLLSGLSRGPKAGKAVPSKNLAVFTRQFSVMIDAGLPLVECLEILGRQEEDANFGETILQVPRSCRERVWASRSDESVPEDVRSTLYEHDRRWRGRRDP